MVVATRHQHHILSRKKRKGSKDLKKGQASLVHPLVLEKKKLFQKIHIIDFFFFNVVLAETRSHGHP